MGKGVDRVYCQVIVDIIHEHVAEPYTYLIPEGIEDYGRYQKGQKR